MREIKFRAWDERKEIMQNDFEFITSGKTGSDWIVFVSDKQLLSSQPHPFENPHFSQQLKIMQFTGLLDKNGNEIFEGDIVGFLGGNWMDDELLPRQGIIEWDEENLRWAVVSDIGPIPDLRKSYDDGKFEVLGNIYENPEQP